MLAGAAAVFPSAAMAAVGESPKVSVFGILGDGTALSEGAAYGSDQSADNYSPYSVYSNVGPDSSYIKYGGKDSGEYVARKKAVIAETKVRLGRIPAYVEKKKWFEVKVSGRQARHQERC
jgi:photosystem II oxygen-evolving enhancer protein 3